MGMSLEAFNKLKPGDLVTIDAVIVGDSHSTPSNTVAMVYRGNKCPIPIGIHHSFLNKVGDQ